MLYLIECPECKGSGFYDGICESCNGSGEGVHESKQCGICKGSGEQSVKCSTCNGVGGIEKWYRCYDDERKCLECGEFVNCLIVDTSEKENFEFSICIECISKALAGKYRE